MLMKRIVAAAVMAVFCGSAAFAQPTATLEGTGSGGSFDWELSFTPDTNLFTTTNLGMGGSLATAFQLEVGDGGFSNVSVMPAFNETINSVEIENPGFDPYISDTSIGVTTHTDVASQLGDLVGATVDALFVPLGSEFFTSGGGKMALTFTTTQNEVAFGGLVAQAGAEYSIAAMIAEVSDGPTPLLGDANKDGAVTGADLGSVTSNFGNVGAVPLQGDANNDGAVTGADLGSVTSNFGAVAPVSGLNAVTVPEPSTAVLALAVCGAAAIGYRRS